MGNKQLIWIIGLLGVQATAWAQTDRYVAFFSDKTGTPYTTDAPEAFLSERALAR
ncbi:MAG TPA: serine protease, partial [Cytophagales bacterium]|nr:serine protease [Cytophagales bacterium]